MSFNPKKINLGNTGTKLLKKVDLDTQDLGFEDDLDIFLEEEKCVEVVNKSTVEKVEVDIFSHMKEVEVEDEVTYTGKIGF